MTLDIQKNLNLQEDIELEDQLSCLTADLVEYKSNQQFIKNLFAIEAGKWTNIDTLCKGMTNIKTELELIKNSCDGLLQVTWLDYPMTTMGEGYCVIIFYLESLHWDNVALYNKHHLLS